MNTSEQNTPLTANQIARKIGRSQQGVTDTLRRLGIQPLFVSPAGRFFSPDTTETVDAAMRKPNRPAANR